MNKKELIDATHQYMGDSYPRSAAADAVDGIIEAITKDLKAGEKVRIAGLGIFETGERAARTGRNPRTGDPVQIAACKVIKFKPSKALKESVNE